MTIQPTRRPPVEVLAEWLALGVYHGETQPPLSIQGTPLGDLIASLIENEEISGDLGALTTIHAPIGCASGSVLIVGLGKREAFDAGAAFSAGVAITKRLAGKKRGTVAVALPQSSQILAIASALVEGLIVGTHGPGLRKSDSGRHEFETLLIVDNGSDIVEAIDRGRIVGESVNLARTLVNLPPREKSPRIFAEKAREVAKTSGLSIEVWDESKIRAERFGGLLGVSAGSDEPPAFVVLDHHHGGDAPTFALVGKGVTFDSGGLSLKPSASMEDMKCDMAGAAVVLSSLAAISQLELPVNVRGYLALTENMTGGKAMKLGDVLTMRNGKTVEVLNTDAEGRLILADALSYAVEGKPSRILDLATLTGACMVALGTKVAGLFANNDQFAASVTAASALSGERTWRLPLDDDYKEALKSQVADLKNVGGKWGSAITAARFLQEFVAEIPWVHLDIAGPAWADTECATRDSGGTGCFVRTLVHLIEAEAQNEQAAT
jgi:leucyl aminopeptidase